MLPYHPPPGQADNKHIVVVLTLTRIIKSVVTGQAPVTLELRNTLGKNTHNPRWYTRILQLTQFMPPPETYKSEIGSSLRCAGSMSGAYVSLLAPGKTDYTACHPRKTNTYITRSINHYAYARQTQVKWKKNKEQIRRERKGKEKKRRKRKKKTKKEKKEQEKTRKARKGKTRRGSKERKREKNVIPADPSHYIRLLLLRVSIGGQYYGRMPPPRVVGIALLQKVGETGPSINRNLGKSNMTQNQ